MRRSRWLKYMDFEFPEAEYPQTLNAWKRMKRQGGATLSASSVPRHISGFFETEHPVSMKSVRWFPYKEEMTVDSCSVATFKDVLYTHYFPREYNDDERVKYVSIKTGRTEIDIAKEIFMMRRVKLYCAQTLRNLIWNNISSPPKGLEYNEFEKRYFASILDVYTTFNTELPKITTPDPRLLYTSELEMGECVDMIMALQVRHATMYTMCDIVVHKSLPHARMTNVRDDPKEPLSELEPCMFEYMKLKLAVMALIALQSNYITDEYPEFGNTYSGIIIHFYPSVHDPTKIENNVINFNLDMELAKT